MSIRWTSPLPSKRGQDVKALPANGIVEDVDLATFKPTFILRGSKPKDAEKEKKKNKKQKSSKGGPLAFFDMDEDGGESLSLTAVRQKHRDWDSERPRKKKRKDGEGDGHDDMWVEKPPSYIVEALPITDVSSDEGNQVGQESGPPGARKRAIDFVYIQLRKLTSILASLITLYHDASITMDVRVSNICTIVIGWEGMYSGSCGDMNRTHVRSAVEEGGYNWLVGCYNGSELPRVLGVSLQLKERHP
ncbi:hypothetical protein DFJ58DRAFT_178448 [Suillus subalutaceus]|uniref:uncharacterized protein n=1 Tax=Suillus subalutaceus TaxID=48586 RepID=UPI001B85FEDA|nr:uncharacterized protein DFJ58DRAFT_178448 [Suillus subalutaceus]KAG1876507.1 hypothetical protein DFJ58DRAFT_178448 [Suillus subalutaceus]